MKLRLAAALPTIIQCSVRASQFGKMSGKLSRVVRFIRGLLGCARLCPRWCGESTNPVQRGQSSMTENKSPSRLKDELRILLGRIEEVPLSSRLRSLKLLRAYARLRETRLKSGLRAKLVKLLGLLGVCLLVYLARDYYHSVKYDRCLIDQPPLVRQIFRPAEDCSVCRDVKHVEKISNVDPKLFEERYAYSGRPVVIRDATNGWSAMQVFSFAFLKELYEGQDANCQFFPYKTEFRSLQDVFNMSTSRALLQAGSKPWYVGWSNCDQAIGTILRKHYQRPYFLPDTAESEKTDWLFMGSPGYGAPMHIDDVEYPSWQAQIRGHKTWILEPPRECHYSCNRVEVTVNPGEIIVLDTNKWYHQTLIVSDDVSITIGAEYD
ncbi:PREDICTED: uncharacterized protein LOC105359040 [Ceratosolen solmsi marchali]|uniref:Uncharacterized protein LOC105359040 n=1 Tax=Ceratosolen solmsi marchali TaxID=326594 RepID=A0AAJ6VJW4_9HYME|nr:PREDICTED: uncharacterized protein LOC105359040 [Ceratosolen solmsi marchali]